RHGTERPEPVTQFRADVPPEVAAVVLKLLAKHPENRYQTPADLAAALEPYAVSGTIPWAPLPSPTAPFLDGLATPVEPGDGAKPAIAECASDEMWALATTVSPAGEPTPPNTPPALLVPRRTRPVPYNYGRLIIAVLLAVFLVGGAVLTLATIAALF